MRRNFMSPNICKVAPREVLVIRRNCRSPNICRILRNIVLEMGSLRRRILRSRVKADEYWEDHWQISLTQIRKDKSVSGIIISSSNFLYMLWTVHMMTAQTLDWTGANLLDCLLSELAWPHVLARKSSMWDSQSKTEKSRRPQLKLDVFSSFHADYYACTCTKKKKKKTRAMS